MDYEEIVDEISYWENQMSRHRFAIDECEETISELYKQLRELGDD